MVEWDSWLPADKWGKWGKWGLVETEEDTMAAQATLDVTLDEIEDDQVEEDDALAVPGTPADGIDIENMTTDEIEEKEAKKVEEEKEKGEEPAQAKDGDGEYGTSGSICPSLNPLSHAHTLTPPPS